jgi:predicted O-methyltransferase YrrM
MDSIVTPASTQVHILDVCNSLRKTTWPIWLKYGLNNRPYENPPVVTLYPELIVLRGEYLRHLAEQSRARILAEVGTARGFQTMMWAQYLADAGSDGLVYTCDVVGMDQRVFKTPLTGDSVLTRQQLWDDAPERHRVRFVHGDARDLAAALRDRLDLVYIDGQHTDAWVTHDFRALRPHLNDRAIVVFDDCDDRFPGVQDAVTRISAELRSPIEIVEFTPSPYKLAVIRMPGHDQR